MKTRSIGFSLVIIMITVMLGACSTSKEARKMNHAINGNWVLETIVTEGATGEIKDKIFNESDFTCFIGSEWNFIPKTNMGSYAIIDKQKGCHIVKRTISWSFSETKDAPSKFVLNRLDEKNTPMDKQAQFLTVSQLDKKLMKLKADIMYEGHPASITYNFVKN